MSKSGGNKASIVVPVDESTADEAENSCAHAHGELLGAMEICHAG